MKLNKILILFATVAILSGCNKDFLETRPTGSIATGNVFTTTENAMAALNGVHRSMYIQYYDNQDQGGQSANMIYMEVLGDDFVFTDDNVWFRGSYRWEDHRNAANKIPYFNYRFYYTIIANVNNIIDNVDGVEGPQVTRNIIKGEALTYRAWSMFQMIQLYGKRFDKNSSNDTPGIPLIISSTDLSPKPRASVAEVYKQINDDLDAAMSLFQNTPARANKSHFDLSVAKAIKARVALTQQDYENAAKFANEARQGYTLMPRADLLKGFNDYTNPEWIWGMHQIAEHTTEYFSFFSYVAANFSSFSMRSNPKGINSLLYAKISSTDARRNLWDPTGTNTAFPVPTNPSTGAVLGVRKPYMTRKFLTTPADGSSSIGDLPLIRAAEMYLIEAEALARQNDNRAQQVLYDFVIARDPGYSKSTKTGADLIEEIITHKRIELWGEGHRFYELKRLNEGMSRVGSNHIQSVCIVMEIPVGDVRWEFLIPQTEINITNGLIEQNPL